MGGCAGALALVALPQPVMDRIMIASATIAATVSFMNAHGSRVITRLTMIFSLEGFLIASSLLLQMFSGATRMLDLVRVTAGGKMKERP